MKVLLSALLAIATTTLAVAALRAPSSWSEQAKLTASDAAEADFFGWRVALDGDTALIGAWYDDDASSHSGSAYVFVGSNTGWSEQAKLTASDATSYYEFGSSVSISGDTALVGAHYDDSAGNDAGAAYVFVRAGTSWSQQAELLAGDSTASHEFGWSVSVCGDTALVDAHRDDQGGIAAGAAYVFVRSGTTWTQEAKLTASDAEQQDRFGWSVAPAGNRAIVAAPCKDSNGTDAGGMPFEGLLLLGYDNLAREYVSIWLDTMSTWPSIARGKENDEGEVVQVGTMYDVITPEGRPYKHVSWEKGDDELHAKMIDTLPDGTEWVVMEMTYRRKK